MSAQLQEILHQIGLKDAPLPTLLLAALGAAVVGGYALSWARMVLGLFIFPGYSLKKFGAGKGSWALVTGATDGIGREFALQLAKAGFNIFLVSRSPEKLGKVAGEIEAKYSVQTKTHAMDFAEGEPTAYSALADTVNNLDIGVLVNNVGKSHDMPVPFQDTPVDEMDNIVEINVNSLLRVTRIVVPGMVERHRGLILNMGSFASLVPSPFLATYAGTKAFIAIFSQALGAELKPKGVVVRNINTYFVVSAMTKIRRPSLFIPVPSAHVRSVLSTLGNACGAVGRPFTSTPYWSHALLDWLIETLGHAGKASLISYNYALLQDIRRRALRKREREAKAK